MTSYADIFEKQSHLMYRFETAEVENGFTHWPGVIPDECFDHRRAQAKLRMLAGYVVEEIAEALDEKWCGSTNFHEEIADAFHYLVELLIVSGVPIQHGDLESTFATAMKFTCQAEGMEWSQFIVTLMRAINMLKNKPEKKRLRPLDLGLFRVRLVQAFEYFIAAAKHDGITAEILAASYFSKADVNNQRLDGKV